MASSECGADELIRSIYEGLTAIMAAAMGDPRIKEEAVLLERLQELDVTIWDTADIAKEMSFHG